MRVFVFPACRSGGPDRLRRALADGGEEAARILEEARGVLRDDLRASLDRAPEPGGRDDQLATFLAAHMRLAALRHAVGDARWSVGAGVGEYNHLVHIGALAFGDAVRLVDARGRAFERGPEGAMLSVDGVDAKVVRSVLDELTGIAEIGAFEGPSRQVIAGERATVRIAKLKLEQLHLARCRLLPERRPVHCDLFEPVAEILEPWLWRAAWRLPQRPYFPNVRGEPVPEARAFDFVLALRGQVHRPVLWAQSMEWIATHVPGAVFVRVAEVAERHGQFSDTTTSPLTGTPASTNSSGID